MLGLFVAFAALVAACGSSADPVGESLAFSSENENALRIGLVSPSAVDDLAFTQSMVESLERIANNRAIVVEVSAEVTEASDAAALMAEYVAAEVDLIIAHGSQFGGPVRELAQANPDVAFAWGTASDTFELPNVSAYDVRSDQGGFVLGQMAAELSEAGRVGAIGPVAIGDAQLFIDGYLNGAEDFSPQIEVMVDYTESFSNLGLGTAAAESQVAAGVDVLTGTSQMSVGPAAVARSSGLAWFGNQVDQSSLGVNVVASQVYRWEYAIEPVLEGLDQGDLGGEVWILTLANRGIEIRFNDNADVSDAVRQAANRAIEGIINGSLDTGVL